MEAEEEDDDDEDNQVEVDALGDDLRTMSRDEGRRRRLCSSPRRSRRSLAAAAARPKGTPRHHAVSSVAYLFSQTLA